jgi:hypothetical protein
MAISKFDKWLIAENRDGSRRYIIHTQRPRFIGEIVDNDLGGSDVTEFEIIDEMPLDAAAVAALMREAGEAIAEYDRTLMD